MTVNSVIVWTLHDFNGKFVLFIWCVLCVHHHFVLIPLKLSLILSSMRLFRRPDLGL
jgi:hypothetical protein